MFIAIELGGNNLSLLTSFLLYPHLTLFAGFVFPLFFPLILKLHCLTWWQCKHMGYSGIGKYGNVLYLNVKYTRSYTVTSLLTNVLFCHFMWWWSTTMPCSCFNHRHTLHQTKRPITVTHIFHYKWHQMHVEKVCLLRTGKVVDLMKFMECNL